MTSVQQITSWVEFLYQKSLQYYKKLDRSAVFNDQPREKLAHAAIQPHLTELVKRNALSQNEIQILVNETVKKLCKDGR